MESFNVKGKSEFFNVMEKLFFQCHGQICPVALLAHRGGLCGATHPHGRAAFRGVRATGQPHSEMIARALTEGQAYKPPDKGSLNGAPMMGTYQGPLSGAPIKGSYKGSCKGLLT